MDRSGYHYEDLPTQQLEALASAFAAVGRDFEKATLEAVSTLSDERLQAAVAANLNEHGWPDPEDFKMLDELRPGMVASIFDRANVIQIERHAEELRQARKPLNILKGLLRGVRSIRL